MKTQISRDSFAARKRYSGVYQQMGRMLTDADWNELSDLVKNRLADTVTDLVGTGTPRQRGLVEILPQADGSTLYRLRWGYAYVDGVGAQVRPDPAATLLDPSGTAFEYEHQLDFPLAPAATGDHKLYLDVWERSVIALEDTDLLDAGLHGADTCSRTLTMAQVKWCEPGLDPEDAGQNPPIGTARLTLTLRQGSTDPDPCDPCADEMTRQDKVGNCLYRVEIHHVDYDAGGLPQQITLKWSSENGAEHYVIGETPVGFESAHWAYEFCQGAPQAFASEKHLGKHLVGGFVPARGELSKGYPDTVPAGFEQVRRWDGFCVLTKSGGTWNLVAGSGADRGVELSAATSADAHGHVTAGTSVTLNLYAMTANLEMADLQLLAGDYWQAAVRQAVHVAGSEILPAAEPGGIRHHYMTLGVVAGGVFTAWDAAECKRFGFPPLTDIRAADVCYDSQVCDMPDVKTVQEALDRLCQERDLRWHNKHLHGWGIVCGLIAECCPAHAGEVTAGFDSRRNVCVTPGYALTCDGEDLVLNGRRDVPVLDQIAALEAAGQKLLTEGRGTVCLRLDMGAGGEPEINVEAYNAAAKNSLFDGTLLMDFYEHCVKGLMDALKGELTLLGADEIAALEGGTTGLVGNQRRKLTSVLNLIVQIFNPGNGGYVFISHKEHLILKDFYLHLREILRSKTFCAMFDGAEFPEYPFADRGTTTYFGKNLHTKITLHPGGENLYTYGGTDSTINIYAVESGELIKVLTMPAAEGAEITALSFSGDGTLMYAAASVRQTDTVFGRARVRDDHTWEDMTILCDITISAMQESPRDEGLFYALGLGKGLYFLRPDILFEDIQPQPLPTYAFNAVGHMELDFDEFNAYCTAATATDATSTYTRVVVCSLDRTGESLNPDLSMPLMDVTGLLLSGSDGISLRRSQNAAERRLYVVVANNSGKRLLTYQRPLSLAAQFRATLSIENTQVALQYHPMQDCLLLALEDGYRLQAIEPDGGATRVFRAPVQIQPIDLVVEPGKGQIYALNYLSNTVSVIPANELAVDNAFLQTLVDYRTSVLLAFYALFGNVMQYLKDCFCHHLLVKCPSCDDADVIYLATVEIRDNQVYKICNFDKRKYVKSFPTVGYWVSIVPVVPLIKQAVEKFCCAVLPNLLDKYTAKVVRKPEVPPAQQQVATNSIKAATSRNLVRTTQRTDTRAILRNQSKGIKAVAQMVGDSTTSFVRINQSNQPGIKKQTLLQAQTQDAVAELGRNQIVVAGVEEYDPDKANTYIADYTKTPQTIKRGSTVTLVQKDGKVMYYAVKQPVQTAGVAEIPAEVKAELTALENRKSALADLDAVKAELAQAENRRQNLAQMENLKNELAALQATKTTVEAELAGVRSAIESIKTARGEEETKLAQIKSQRETVAGEINLLKDNLESLDTMRKEIALEVNKNRPVKDIAEVDVQTDTLLREAGIRTLEELAGADKQRLRVNTNLDEGKIEQLVKGARGKLGLLP
jgi:hypothetical protein